MKMEPVRLRFILTPGTYYLDAAREMSKVMRRLVKQGQDFTIVGGLIKDSNNQSTVVFNTAPRSWATRTAWRRGLKLFNKMNNQRIKEGGYGAIKPKYHDYKVFLNPAHNASNMMVTLDAAGNQVMNGEWVYSEYITEDIEWDAASLTSQANRDADGFNAMLVGQQHVAGTGGQDVWDRISLLKSWAETRPQPENEPDTVPFAAATDPLGNLFDESDADDEVISNLNTDNDEPPYNKALPYGAQYLGGPLIGDNLQRQSFAATQSGAGSISPFSGFKALCGLIQVDVNMASPGGANEVEVLIDILPKGEKI
jgi:hypothetical protein